MDEVEPLVEASDLLPIGFFGGGCLGMNGGDGGLQQIGAPWTEPQCFFDEVATLFGFLPVPSRAILIGKDLVFIHSHYSRLTPCVLIALHCLKCTHYTWLHA